MLVHWELVLQAKVVPLRTCTDFWRSSACFVPFSPLFEPNFHCLWWVTPSTPNNMLSKSIYIIVGVERMLYLVWYNNLPISFEFCWSPSPHTLLAAFVFSPWGRIRIVDNCCNSFFTVQFLVTSMTRCPNQNLISTQNCKDKDYTEYLVTSIYQMALDLH